jgi:hypothetical protein
MTNCHVCGQPQCVELVDFGRQPLCHHFFDGNQVEGVYPLVLGQCDHCGIVQLTKRIDPQQMLPRFDWLAYNEPEQHVDALVNLLRSLPGITPGANICGISHKDESTLRRFRERGFEKVWRIDPRSDLAMNHPREGIETIQHRLKPELADGLRKKYGAPDLIIARHVIEHTHDTVGFMETLRRLVKPTGYVVVEIPDCREPFELLDYTALWEDHTLYFEETTLRTCLAIGGFSTVHIECYPAPYETAVVAIAQLQSGVAITNAPPVERLKWQQTAHRFAQSWSTRRQALREKLADWRNDGKVVLFGAGHHAVMFTNLMGVADLIEFVIDDHPKKRGLHMPGSRLPIVGSENLTHEDIKLCLSSLGAGSEKKVMEKHQGFVQRGGTFAAIFPTTREEPLSLLAGPARPAKSCCAP